MAPPAAGANNKPNHKVAIVNPYLRRKPQKQQPVGGSNKNNNNNNAQSSVVAPKNDVSVKSSSAQLSSSNRISQHPPPPQHSMARKNQVVCTSSNDTGVKTATTKTEAGNSRSTTKKAPLSSVAKVGGKVNNNNNNNMASSTGKQTVLATNGTGNTGATSKGMAAGSRQVLSASASASASASQPKSLKAKLKRDIENIKKARLLEQQKKELRKEQKALEKQRRLQAIEDEKRRKQQQADEERRRQLQAEQERLAQERLKMEQERQHKKLEEERQKKLSLQQEELARMQQRMEQERRLAQIQQQQQQVQYHYPHHHGQQHQYPHMVMMQNNWMPASNRALYPAASATGPYYPPTAALAGTTGVASSSLASYQYHQWPTQQHWTDNRSTQGVYGQYQQQVQQQVQQQPHGQAVLQQIHPSTCQVSSNSLLTLTSQTGQSNNSCFGGSNFVDHLSREEENQPIKPTEVESAQKQTSSLLEKQQDLDATTVLVGSPQALPTCYMKKVSVGEKDIIRNDESHTIGDSRTTLLQTEAQADTAKNESSVESPTTTHELLFATMTTKELKVSCDEVKQLSLVTPAVRRDHGSELIHGQKADDTRGEGEMCTHLTPFSEDVQQNTASIANHSPPISEHHITPHKTPPLSETTTPKETSCHSTLQGTIVGHGMIVSPIVDATRTDKLVTETTTSENTHPGGSVEESPEPFSSKYTDRIDSAPFSPNSMQHSSALAASSISERNPINQVSSVTSALSVSVEAKESAPTVACAQPTRNGGVGNAALPIVGAAGTKTITPNHREETSIYPQWGTSCAYNITSEYQNMSTHPWYQNVSSQHPGGAFNPVVSQNSATVPYQVQWQQPALPYAYPHASLYAAHGIMPGSFQLAYPTPSYPRSYTFPRAKSRPRKPKPLVVERLALSPIEAPSPFAMTYMIMKQEFVIIKKEGESFELSLREDKLSALVDPDWHLAYEQRMKKATILPPATESPCTSNDTQEPSSSSVQEQICTDENKEIQVERSGGRRPKMPEQDIVHPVSNSPKSQETDQPSDANMQTSTQVLEQKPKKKKRKRHFFAVLAIMDATKQNERIQSTMHLMPGDIVLSINGISPGGQEFREACTLFGKNFTVKEENGTKNVYCTLSIARKKPEPKPVYSLPNLKIPTAYNTTNNVSNETQPAVSKPLNHTDIQEYVGCVMRALGDPGRLLGSAVSDDSLRKFLLLSPPLQGRDILLRHAWNQIVSSIESVMMKRAKLFWTSQWQNESEAVRKSVSLPYLTDAARARMRASPRPSKGCKCGSKEHEYVTDVNCALYSDLRTLSQMEVENQPQAPKHKPKKNGDERPLNVVETAFKERFVKLQSEKKALEEEASFVDEMEVLQVKKLKKAIFAPSLTAMVLSAIVDLQGEFPRVEEPEEITISLARSKSLVDENDEVEEPDGEDDDDIPLAALGKRDVVSEQMQTPNKKQKVASEQISKNFLAKMLLLISERWGHLYQEQSNSDFAWRWEVFHGQTESDEGCKWEAHAKNPRQPQSHSFENLRFVLDDDFMKALSTRDNGSEDSQSCSEEEVNAEAVLTYLLSPERTGVLDEILAMVSSSLIAIKGSIPRLSKDWYSRVDLLLLNEMHECWDPDVDKSGKYFVNDEIRRKLSKRWIMRDDGWALKNEPSDIIYWFDEWEAWQNTFESKQEEKALNEHEIGKFGI